MNNMSQINKLSHRQKKIAKFEIFPQVFIWQIPVNHSVLRKE